MTLGTDTADLLMSHVRHGSRGDALQLQDLVAQHPDVGPLWSKVLVAPGNKDREQRFRQELARALLDASFAAMIASAVREAVESGVRVEQRAHIGDHSKGAQIYQAGRDVNVNPNRRKLLIAIATVTILALIGVAALLYRTVPRTDIELSAFTVAKPTKVPARQFGSGTMNGKEFVTEYGKKPVDVTPIDITLKNNGNIPAVFLKAKFHVTYAKTLENCKRSGGDVIVSAEYQVALPKMPPGQQDALATPFDLESDMRFEVRGGVTDRFTLSMGPSEQTGSSPTPWLIVADISLMDDKGASTRAGTAAIVSLSGEGLENFLAAPPSETRCIDDNLKKINEVFAIQADARAEELTILRENYTKLTTPAGMPAQEVCTQSSGELISEVCGRLGRASFGMRIRLDHAPVSGSDSITVIIPAVSGDQSVPFYRRTFKYESFPSSPTPTWSEVQGEMQGVSFLFTAKSDPADRNIVILSGDAKSQLLILDKVGVSVSAGRGSPTGVTLSSPVLVEIPRGD